VSNIKPTIYTGIAFAVLACVIWSGNFIVARAFIKDVPPIALSLFRWSVATLILFPFTIRQFWLEKHIVFQHKQYFFWTSVFGVAIFNTFLYIAAHTTSAINMALIGTCSSPIFSVFLAAVVLKERVTSFRIIGMLVMLAGIVFLLVKGSWQRLTSFHFTTGDLWVLGAAIFFAAYNIMVRRKPKGISAMVFLFTTFFIGAMVLLPFYLIEKQHSAPVEWTSNLTWVVLYLGLGTSIISFMLWNSSIARLGAARTALFGNLIPLFSSLEALWVLHEEITTFHLVSGVLIVIGLIIANFKR
jgi:drug/metabolite transporter (DMT)-like permease